MVMDEYMKSFRNDVNNSFNNTHIWINKYEKFYLCSFCIANEIHHVRMFNILSIDFRQKWMHSHRIEMVLEHDIPLPKCLHIPHTTGRFNIVQCRQAYTILTALLREWCSFILIEGLSYVKLLHKLVEF